MTGSVQSRLGRLAVSVFAAGALLQQTASAETPAYAPNPNALPDWAKVQAPVPRRALVIGIGAYAHADALATPPVDAQKIADALKFADGGMAIAIAQPADLDRAHLIAKVQAFAASVQPGDIVFVYYSGHGTAAYNTDYIVPADALPAKPGHEEFAYLGIQYVIDELQQHKPGATVMILDACRVDPFAGVTDDGPRIPTPDGYAAPPRLIRTTHQAPVLPSPPAPPTPPASSGFINFSAPSTYMVAFASGDGKPSYSLFSSDKDASDGSIFTRSFAYQLGMVKAPIGAVFARSAIQVQLWTGGLQSPELGGDGAGQIVVPDVTYNTPDEEELWTYTVLQAGSDPAENLNLFIATYPASIHAKAARDRIAWLRTQAKSPAVIAPLPVSPAPSDSTVLVGALKSPGATHAATGLVIAAHDVNVRAAPFADRSKKIGVLTSGTHVQLLEPAAREGWAKIMLEHGQIGYVGSTFPQKVAQALTQVLQGNNFDSVAQLSSAWKAAAQRQGAVVQVAVGPVTGVSEWQARQLSTLRAFRARAALIAQNIPATQITLVVDSASVQSNTTRIYVTEPGS